jgi:hypothetical protein
LNCRAIDRCSIAGVLPAFDTGAGAIGKGYLPSASARACASFAFASSPWLR